MQARILAAAILIALTVAPLASATTDADVRYGRVDGHCNKIIGDGFTVARIDGGGSCHLTWTPWLPDANYSVSVTGDNRTLAAVQDFAADGVDVSICTYNYSGPPQNCNTGEAFSFIMAAAAPPPTLPAPEETTLVLAVIGLGTVGLVLVLKARR